MRKNRITCLFLLIMSMIFRYNFGGFVPSFLFNTLLTLLFFSIGYTIYVYIRFKFVQDIDKRVITKGDSVKLVVKLSNEDFIIYPYIYVSFFGSHSLFNAASYSQSLVITPFSKKEFVFNLECKYRGQYEIGISDIYIEDLLGLIRLKYRISETKKIIVYPKIVPIEKFNVLTANSSDSISFFQGSVEDVNNIKDLRDYNYGDSFRKVHWKLSARNNKLLVKNYQSTSDASVNILLDLRRNIFSEDINLILEDKLIETAVSVLHYYVSKGITVNYMYYFLDKFEIIKASNSTDFNYIYKFLASVEFNQTVPLADIVKLYYEGSNVLSDIIIFSSILDTALYNEVYNAHMSNHTISLVYISPKSLSSTNSEIVDSIIDNLLEIGVKVYFINPDDDISVNNIFQ